MAVRKTILDALAAGPISGPELASQLDISRAGVWKRIEELRESGFEIESTEGGYEVVSVPEFGGPAIEHGLDAPYEVEYHDAISSTNARARELAVAGESNIVVLADEQTAGRGRLDRTWSAPSGGIYMSFVLRPEITPMEAPLLTLAAAVATTRALREAGVEAGIKWPNDILVSEDTRASRTDSDDVLLELTGEKLVGILTEMEGEADRVSWVVCGIGVNANVEGEELPEGATSVREQVGDIDRRPFVQRVIEGFESIRSDPDAILEAWRKHAITLGRRVRVETPRGAIVGEAIDIESPGQLVIESSEEVIRVHAGDCEHLRPAD